MVCHFRWCDAKHFTVNLLGMSYKFIVFFLLFRHGFFSTTRSNILYL